MLGLNVRINLDVLRAQAGEFVRQIPIAEAASLSRVGVDAGEILKAGLPSYFTIRTPWVAKGIRNEMVRKGAAPAVMVGSLDWFMELQSEGGVRKPGDRPIVAVPVAARKHSQTITRQSRWPGKLDDPGTSGGGGYKGDVFSGTVVTRKGPMLGTWKRVMRGANGKPLTGSQSKTLRQASDIATRSRVSVYGKKGQAAKPGVIPQFMLLPSVTIKPRWPLLPTVQRVVNERWEGYALKALEEAKRTAGQKGMRWRPNWWR